MSYAEWKEWHQEAFGRFSDEDALYYKRELDRSGITDLAGLAIFELGFGNGTFAGWARAAGAQWVGQEVSIELARRASECGFEALRGDETLSSALGSETHDLVVAFDVVEHLTVPEILQFFLDAHDVLKDDGRLVLRCPSGDSPFSSAMYFGDVTHRTLLGSSAVRQLAAETGLVAIQIRGTTLPIAGYGILRSGRRLLVSVVRALAFSVVRIVMGHRTAVLEPNMIVVLAKPSKPGAIQGGGSVGTHK